MSKSRIPSHERVSGRPNVGPTGEAQRFIGISLGGGKTDKACVAVLEYYPKFKKIFLSKIFDKIKSEGSISADLKIHEIVSGYKNAVDLLAFDGPWQLPLCQRCQKTCPGYEACSEDHIQWMRDYNQHQQKKKKPKRLFTPYTERSVEMYLKTEIEEPMAIGPALGANAAPLLARAAFIHRRLNIPAVEVHPKLSLWRIGRAFNISKTHLRRHRHSADGNDSRRIILQALAANSVAFVYDQDHRLMIENSHAFEAYICALTAYLKSSDQTESRPQGFPEQEDWIEFPKSEIQWPG